VPPANRPIRSGLKINTQEPWSWGRKYCFLKKELHILVIIFSNARLVPANPSEGWSIYICGVPETQPGLCLDINW
jgi:hypothetical protein